MDQNLYPKLCQKVKKKPINYQTLDQIPNIRSTEQMLYQQNKCQINRSKVRSTGQKVDQSDQKLRQQIKIKINTIT